MSGRETRIEGSDVRAEESAAPGRWKRGLWMVVNLVLVAGFSARAIGAVYGVFAMPLCDPWFIQWTTDAVTLLNYPAYLLAAALGAVIPVEPRVEFVITQALWAALVVPQWLAFFWLIRVIRSRLWGSV